MIMVGVIPTKRAVSSQTNPVSLLTCSTSCLLHHVLVHVSATILDQKTLIRISKVHLGVNGSV